MKPTRQPARPTLVDGRFYHEGAFLAPVGFNYWPSRSGVHCWKAFDLNEWEEDFCEIRRRGYDTVRFFLLWPDFQPGEDNVDVEKLRDFSRVMELAREYELWTMPTIFQGWMSGTNFDPPWRAGRNHIRDRSLRKAMACLVESVCERLVDAPRVLALDLANEIDAICQDVDGPAIQEWTADLRSVVERVAPGLLVTNGCALTPMRSTSPWTYADQSVDFHCMHGYPMFWTPLPTCSLRTARSSLIFGAMTSFAGAYGPVMRQEYGPGIGGDGPLIRGFIRASSFAAYLGGANGFLYWCWRDFSSTEEPYKKDPMESSLGYVNASLRAKEFAGGLDDFQRFFQNHADWLPVPDPISIYIPREFKGLGESADEAMALAYESLVANGCLPRFASVVDPCARIIVTPVSHLGIDEIETLDSFCLQGGIVIALGVASKTCGHAWELLAGTRQIDVFRSVKPALEIDDPDAGVTGLKLPLPGRRMMPWPVMEAIRDDVCVWLTAGTMPAGTCAPRGKGRFIQFVPPLTGQETEDTDPVHVALWRKMLSLAGWSSWSVSSPNVQVGVLQNRAGEQKLLVINHASEGREVRVKKGDVDIVCRLPGKDAITRPL